MPAPPAKKAKDIDDLLEDLKVEAETDKRETQSRVQQVRSKKLL